MDQDEGVELWDVWLSISGCIKRFLALTITSLPTPSLPVDDREEAKHRQWEELAGELGTRIIPSEILPLLYRFRALTIFSSRLRLRSMIETSMDIVERFEKLLDTAPRMAAAADVQLYMDYFRLTQGLSEALERPVDVKYALSLAGSGSSFVDHYIGCYRLRVSPTFSSGFRSSVAMAIEQRAVPFMVRSLAKVTLPQGVRASVLPTGALAVHSLYVTALYVSGPSGGTQRLQFVWGGCLRSARVPRAVTGATSLTEALDAVADATCRFSVRQARPTLVAPSLTWGVVGDVKRAVCAPRQPKSAFAADIAVELGSTTDYLVVAHGLPPLRLVPSPDGCRVVVPPCYCKEMLSHVLPTTLSGTASEAAHILREAVPVLQLSALALGGVPSYAEGKHRVRVALGRGVLVFEEALPFPSVAYERAGRLLTLDDGAWAVFAAISSVSRTLELARTVYSELSRSALTPRAVQRLMKQARERLGPLFEALFSTVSCIPLKYLAPRPFVSLYPVECEGEGILVRPLMQRCLPYVITVHEQASWFTFTSSVREREVLQQARSGHKPALCAGDIRAVLVLALPVVDTARSAPLAVCASTLLRRAAAALGSADLGTFCVARDGGTVLRFEGPGGHYAELDAASGSAHFVLTVDDGRFLTHFPALARLRPEAVSEALAPAIRLYSLWCRLYCALGKDEDFTAGVGPERVSPQRNSSVCVSPASSPSQRRVRLGVGRERPPPQLPGPELVSQVVERLPSRHHLKIDRGAIIGAFIAASVRPSAALLTACAAPEASDWKERHSRHLQAHGLFELKNGQMLISRELLCGIFGAPLANELLVPPTAVMSALKEMGTASVHSLWGKVGVFDTSYVMMVKGRASEQWRFHEGSSASFADFQSAVALERSLEAGHTGTEGTSNGHSPLGGRFKPCLLAAVAGRRAAQCFGSITAGPVTLRATEPSLGGSGLVAKRHPLERPVHVSLSGHPDAGGVGEELSRLLSLHCGRAARVRTITDNVRALVALPYPLMSTLVVASEVPLHIPYLGGRRHVSVKPVSGGYELCIALSLCHAAKHLEWFVALTVSETGIVTQIRPWPVEGDRARHVVWQHRSSFSVEPPVAVSLFAFSLYKTQCSLSDLLNRIAEPVPEIAGAWALLLPQLARHHNLSPDDCESLYREQYSLWLAQCREHRLVRDTLSNDADLQVYLVYAFSTMPDLRGRPWEELYPALFLQRVNTLMAGAAYGQQPYAQQAYGYGRQAWNLYG